jgi:hypothetical protein
VRESYEGPTWHDVAVCVEDLAARRGFRAQLAFVPPYRNPTTQAWNAWGVSVAKPPLPGQPTTGKTVWAYWGRGGAHKSAPAAAYKALLELEDVLAQEEAGAARQAAF